MAEAMKKKFPDQIDLEIHTTDSDAAKGFLFSASTMVLLDNEQVDLQTATEPAAMEKFLQEHL